MPITRCLQSNQNKKTLSTRRLAGLHDVRKNCESVHPQNNFRFSVGINLENTHLVYPFAAKASYYVWIEASVRKAQHPKNMLEVRFGRERISLMFSHRAHTCAPRVVGNTCPHKWGSPSRSLPVLPIFYLFFSHPIYYLLTKQRRRRSQIWRHTPAATNHRLARPRPSIFIARRVHPSLRLSTSVKYIGLVAQSTSTRKAVLCVFLVKRKPPACKRDSNPGPSTVVGYRRTIILFYTTRRRAPMQPGTRRTNSAKSLDGGYCLHRLHR